MANVPYVVFCDFKALNLRKGDSIWRQLKNLDKLKSDDLDKLKQYSNKELIERAKDYSIFSLEEEDFVKFLKKKFGISLNKKPVERIISFLGKLKEQEVEKLNEINDLSKFIKENIINKKIL